MAKKRVHELAKELGLENKDMVTKLQGWGYDVKSHSSTLEDDQVKAVTERIQNERRPAAAPKPTSTGVVIRRSKAKGETLGPAGAEAPLPEAHVPAAAPIEEAPPAPVAEEAAPAPEPQPEEVPEVPVATPAATPAPEAPMPMAAQGAESPAAQAPTPAQPRPTANQAVVMRRIELPNRPQQPPARQAPRPGVSGTAANVRTAPTRPATPPPAAQQAAEAPRPVPPGTDVTHKPDEEIRLIAGVPHVVKKQPEGGSRPTANQAVVVSRPVYIQKQFAPQKARESIPMAPGIKPGTLVRENIREVQVINEGGRARELIDVNKKKRPGATKNEKVENYSKQDLIDLVRARSYIPVIGRKKRATKKGRKTEITEMKASKKVISMEETITVRELSEKMGVKANDLIRKLMKDSGGKMFTINQPVDYDTAALIATEHGWEITRRTFEVSDFVPEVEDKPEDLKPRPPVVTVMGHVDHGKTSLLDALRSANVAEGEAGGITQHIGAYTVTLPGKGDLSFLDTPGHEAFSAMRSRGAQATDIVILVVAADDGVQPQTIESIKHAKAAEVPIVVAINKIDKPGVNPDKIKGDLANQGLQPEDWGGDVPMIPVSARQKTNLDLLLENVLLQAEVLELSANPKKLATGVVIESKIEKGRGPVATMLVQDGTLKQGEAVVSGTRWGRIRTMTNEKGQTLKAVTAGYPVQVVGLDGTPEAGDDFNVVPSEEVAKKIADHRIMKAREADLAKSARLTVEDLVKKTAADAAKELVVIVKADVQGSVQAVVDSLNKLSGKKVRVNVVQSGVGVITENDVNQANASKALIVGFNAKPDANAAASAQQAGVKIKTFSIIYDLLDNVRNEMEDLLEPIYREKPMGKAEVRQVFTVSKVGQIAGCLVTEGKVTRAANVRVLRDRKVQFTGKLSSLKRFKDDVKEVVAGTECGIGIEGFDNLMANDTLDIFEVETLRQKLD